MSFLSVFYRSSSFRLPPRLVSVCMFVILLSVISVAAFKQLTAATKKSSGGKGLEFLRVHKGEKTYLACVTYLD